MNVVILAGGLGARLAEETDLRPKPMVEIGGRPVLWHIMKIYAHHGYKDFMVALGYKGEHIKRYFLDYRTLSGSLTVSLSSGQVTMLENDSEDWTVHLIETGIDTQTGGRIKRLMPQLGNETFMMTYGDAVSDVDVTKLVDFHRSHGKLATVTAVRPSSRFGTMVFDGQSVIDFAEKPQMGEGWINGGFFVLEPGVMDYIAGDETLFERQPLERLAADGQLMGFLHYCFWQQMDTLQEVRQLRHLWDSAAPPWRVWD